MSKLVPLFTVRRTSLDTPTIITLCGSTKFKNEINRANELLTLQGYLVISLGVFGHTDFLNINWSETPIKEKLDRLHLAKIDLADEICVINVGDYIGESTKKEIEYALATGKIVWYWENTPGESRLPDA